MHHHVTEQDNLDLRTAIVGYGSETGNALDYAEELGRTLERLRFITTVASLDSIELAS